MGFEQWQKENSGFDTWQRENVAVAEPPEFDPEGSGFDIKTFRESGGVPDETGHMGSLDPRTGMLLKGRNHPTIHLTLEEEERLGNEIIKKGNRFFSVPKQQLFTPEARPPNLGFGEPFDRQARGDEPTLTGRAAKQFLNKSILDLTEQARPSSGVVESITLMTGVAKDLESLPDDPTFWQGVQSIPKIWWSLVSNFYAPKNKAERAFAAEELKKLRPAISFDVPPPEGVAEKAVDITAGIGAFVTQLLIAKKLIPAGTVLPDVVAWEILNQAEGGIPGQGAAIRGTLGALGKIPTITAGGKAAKIAAGGGLFGGLTAVQGGNFEDVAVSTAIGAGFQAWGIHKQTQWLKGFKRELLRTEKGRVESVRVKGEQAVTKRYRQDVASARAEAASHTQLVNLMQKAAADRQVRNTSLTRNANTEIQRAGKRIDQAMDVISRKLHHGKLKGKEPELAKQIVEKGLTPEAVADVAKVKLPPSKGEAKFAKARAKAMKDVQSGDPKRVAAGNRVLDFLKTRAAGAGKETLEGIPEPTVAEKVVKAVKKPGAAIVRAKKQAEMERAKGPPVAKVAPKKGMPVQKPPTAPVAPPKVTKAQEGVQEAAPTLNKMQQRNADALAKVLKDHPQADNPEGTTKIRMTTPQGMGFHVPARDVEKKLGVGWTLVEKEQQDWATVKDQLVKEKPVGEYDESPTGGADILVEPLDKAPIIEEVRKNEGEEAAQIVKDLLDQEIQTIDTHVRPNEILVQIESSRDVPASVKNLKILEDAGILWEPQKGMTYVRIPRKPAPTETAKEAEALPPSQLSETIKEAVSEKLGAKKAARTAAAKTVSQTQKLFEVQRKTVDEIALNLGQIYGRNPANRKEQISAEKLSDVIVAIRTAYSPTAINPRTKSDIQQMLDEVKNRTEKGFIAVEKKAGGRGAGPVQEKPPPRSARIAHSLHTIAIIIERSSTFKNLPAPAEAGKEGKEETDTGVGAATFGFATQKPALAKAQKLAKKHGLDWYVVQRVGGKFVAQQVKPPKGHYTVVRPSGEATFIKQASPTAEEAFDYGEHLKERKVFTDKLAEFEDKLKQKRVDVKALQNELFGMVKASGMSPAKVKVVVGLLRNIRPGQQAKTNIKTLLKAISKASEYTEQENRRVLRAAIIKELKKAKAVKRQGVRRGKLTPEVQRRLDFIQRHIGENRSAALERMALNIKKVQDGEMDDLAMMEQNALFSMTAIKGMTSQEMLKAYEGIKRLRESGKMVHDAEIAAIKEKRDRIKARVLHILTKGKGLKEGSEALPERDIEKRAFAVTRFNRWGSAFDNILDYLSRFDKTSKPYESDISKLGDQMHIARHEETKGAQKQTTKVHEAFQDIFGVKSNWKMDKILHAMQKRNVNLGKFTNAIGKTIVWKKLSKEELIKRYMEFQDPTLEETFRGVTKKGKDYGMHYTDEMKAAIINSLTKQEKAWADWHLQNYKDYRPSINKVYNDMYFVDMGQVFNYSPINRMAEQEEFEETLLFRELVRHASTRNPSLIERVKSILPLKWTEADSVLMNHIVRMEHFKAYAKPVREVRSIFSDKAIRAAIRQYHGKHILNRLDLELDQFARGGIDQMLVHNWLDRARRNFIVAALSRPNIALKQIPSSLAYITEMPFRDYVTGVTRFWLRPIKHTKELMEHSPIFKDSVKKGHERDIRLAMAKGGSRQIAGTRKFRDWLFVHIKLGDFVGRSTQWAKWKSVQKREGLGIEAAMRKAEKTTSRTQPGWWIGELSAPQKGGSLWKIFTMFQTQPIRYYNIAVDSARNAAYGRGSRLKNLLNLALIWVVMPMLFNWIADAFQWKKKHQGVAIALGPFSYMPIAGKLIYNIALAMVGEAYGTQLSPMQTVPDRIKRAAYTVGRMFRASNDPTKEITNEDAIKLMEQMGEAGGYAFGLPTPYLVQVERAARKAVTLELEEIGKGRIGWRRSAYAEFLLSPYSLRAEDYIKAMTAKELQEELEDSTYKRRYKRDDGKWYPKGHAHKGQEKKVARIKAEIEKRK